MILRDHNFNLRLVDYFDLEKDTQVTSADFRPDWKNKCISHNHRSQLHTLMLWEQILNMLGMYVA
jgi:hypothetical protein